MISMIRGRTLTRLLASLETLERTLNGDGMGPGTGDGRELRGI
jgi:hypothetical protein